MDAPFNADKLIENLLKNTSGGGKMETSDDNDQTDPLANLSKEQIENMIGKLYANDENNKQNVNNNKDCKPFLPEPGFCMKTKNSKDEKVFLNICQSSQVLFTHLTNDKIQ
jgi:hypothetical protein